MLDAVRHTVRLHRALGVARRPRRRIPLQVPPNAIERSYAAALLDIVAAARAAFEPLLAELPDLLAGAQAERLDADAPTPPPGTTGAPAVRSDAGEGRRIRQLIDAAKARIAATFTVQDLEDVAGMIARRTAEHNRVQLGRQVRAALGVDVTLTDRALPAMIDQFVAENIELIRNIPEKLASDIAAATTRAVTSGTLHGDLAKQIAERGGVAANRARLIARDQVGKLYGQINITRMRAAGADGYTWSTVGDRRVRDQHRAREGQFYRFDNPPEGGHPGEAILCRCQASPSFEGLLNDLDGTPAPAAASAAPGEPAIPTFAQLERSKTGSRTVSMSPSRLPPVRDISGAVVQTMKLERQRLENVKAGLRSGADLGPIKVAVHGSGALEIIDGRHRLQALLDEPTRKHPIEFRQGWKDQ